MLPVVALVGRPNTGKSTLFNRLIGKRHAITAHEAGTTRDRVYMHADINDQTVILVDTGGLSFDDSQDFDNKIAEQTQLAIAEADIILFTIDVSQPLTAADHEAAKLLRKTEKPILIVANKVDNSQAKHNIHELYKLGFKEPIEISAIHNLGLGNLEDLISKEIKALPEIEGQVTTKTDTIKIGFIGKPNVGKSSMINKLLGKDQVIVSDVSGTTRDSTFLDFSYEDQDFTLIDTAGIRRRGKQTGIEKFGVMRTLRTIDAVDVALLIVDGSIGLAKQDLHVSQFIIEAHKGMIIVINKADLLKPEEKNRLLSILQHRMQYCPWAPVIFTSALTGTNITKVLELSQQIYEEQAKRIGTSEFNYFLRRTMLKHAPQSHSPQKPKINYATQADGRPPTFVFFCKNVDNLHFSYRRYLENKIREEYGFIGTGIQMVFKNQGRNKLPTDQ